jgi:hypothetical protein
MYNYCIIKNQEYIKMNKSEFIGLVKEKGCFKTNAEAVK